MRLVLDKENRKLLFELLKTHYQVSTLKQLAGKLRVSYPTIKVWSSGKFLIPSKIVPAHILKKIKIIETKKEDWGKAKIVKMQKENPMFLRKTKMKKKMNRLAFLPKHEFQNNEIKLKTDEIPHSRYDKIRGIKLPTVLTPELAEEIGMHIGDGTLPVDKYNYSLRGDIAEREYYTNHVQPLYEKVYGIKTRLLQRPPICGIEFDSKAIYTFKSKVLGLHIGEKVGVIKVPQRIMDSDNPEIYRALLRGINDTDGCFYMPSTRKDPRITITILSKPLIQQLDLILKKLGFKPSTSIKGCTIALNGYIQLHKWMAEIGSKNPKHLKRIHRIKSRIPWKDIKEIIDNTALVL